MGAPSLQDGIDQAGSPMKLLWQQNPAPWNPEGVEPEYAGWRQEQAAWHEAASISDVSHHMFDTTIEGPDATRLLTAVSANNYENFAVGQAKQFVPVTSTGEIVTDGILLRLAEQKYMLTGIPAAQNWVKYHGEQGDYDVAFATDPSSAFRGGSDPWQFRYQVQGPRARDLVETVFGGPLPPAKFFHTTPVTLDGMSFSALRHNMAGQDGYEFIGPWEHATAVKDALMSAGGQFGLVHVGALAYASASVESGWIPSPIPAIYTDPGLAGYRAWLPLFGIEGKRPLNGSFYSDDIEDYYVSPYDLGYGKSIAFNHDFIGREALEKARESHRRTKVTLVLDPADVRAVLGADLGLLPHLRPAPGRGRRRRPGRADPPDRDPRPGGHDPGADADRLRARDAGHRRWRSCGASTPGPAPIPTADLGFPRIRATVAPAPYDAHARTQYRRH